MLDFIMSRRSIFVLMVLGVLVLAAAFVLWRIVRREIAERSAAATLRIDGGALPLPA